MQNTGVTGAMITSHLSLWVADRSVHIATNMNVLRKGRKKRAVCSCNIYVEAPDRFSLDWGGGGVQFTHKDAKQLRCVWRKAWSALALRNTKIRY